MNKENKIKIEQLDHCNQFIIWVNTNVYFQSYNSLIAKVTPGGALTLGRDWDYSNTTLRHLYLFLTRYASYKINDVIYYSKNKKQSIKKLINDGVISYDESMR